MGEPTAGTSQRRQELIELVGPVGEAGRVQGLLTAAKAHDVPVLQHDPDEIGAFPVDSGRDWREAASISDARGLSDESEAFKVVRLLQKVLDSRGVAEADRHVQWIV